MSKDYTIVAISDKRPIQDYYCYDQCIESFKRKGEEIIIFGTADGYNGSLIERPRLMHKIIKEGRIQTSKVLYMDLWDLVLQGTMEEIFEKHKANNCDITISAERNCFPHDLKDEFDKLAPNDTTYKYLNCGVIVGDTEALLAVLEDMDAANLPADSHNAETGWHYPNEQIEFQKVFLRQPVKMALDYKQDITWCLHDVGVHELGYAQGLVYNNGMATFPSILHMNGGGKTSGVREPILNHLKL
jgi:hypothetical protein